MEKLMAELGPGAVFISPSNDVHTIAGQGTIAVEFLEQVSVMFNIVTREKRRTCVSMEHPLRILFWHW